MSLEDLLHPKRSTPLTVPEQQAIAELAGRFSIAPDSLSLIQDIRNFIYRCPFGDGEAIFKVLPSTGDDFPFLMGELAWMAHLRRHGLPVPEVLASREGNLAERLTIEDQDFSAYSLRLIEGPVLYAVDNSEELIQGVGQIAGRMHHVSVGYTTPEETDGRVRRWSEKPWYTSPHDAIHPSMPGVVEGITELRDQLELLSATDFGMVHDDLHGSNIIVSPKGLHVVDFERTRLVSLVSDIASAIFFWVYKTPKSRPEVDIPRARSFLRDFMEGYRREHTLERGWSEAILPLLKDKDLIFLASSPLAGQDFDSLGKLDADFAWRKGRFDADVPFLEMDFSEFE